MNNCFFKSLLFLLGGSLGISCGFSTHPDKDGFLSALDMPENQILEVHQCAMDVNKSSLQQNTDEVIFFKETPIARQYQINENHSLVFSFLNLSLEDYSQVYEPSVAECIRKKVINSNKDVILTGYGYGANLAAWVTNGLLAYPGLFQPAQLKLIIFCAAEDVIEPQSMLKSGLLIEQPRMRKSDLLHFSRFFERRIHPRSPCTEMPLFVFSDLQTRFNPSNLIFILPFLVAINFLATKFLGTNEWKSLTVSRYFLSALLASYYSVKDAPTYLTSSEVRDMLEWGKEQALYAMFFIDPDDD